MTNARTARRRALFATPPIKDPVMTPATNVAIKMPAVTAVLASWARPMPRRVELPLMKDRKKAAQMKKSEDVEIAGERGEADGKKTFASIEADRG